MTRIAGTALFYAEARFEPDARLDYAFVVDGAPTPDPLNPRRVTSGVGGGTVSELVMPDAPADRFSSPRGEVPSGRLLVVEEPWATPKVPSSEASRAA